VHLQRVTNQSRELRIPQAHSEPCVDFLEPAQKKQVVLGKEVLEEVWVDMAETTIPSWMQRAPKNIGSPSSGKVKADQWRTFSAVNLVITLVRLWSHRDDRKPMLDNFLALVMGVRWATMRSTSEQRIQIVQEQLVQYLKSLVTLFSAKVLVTNHHMSLHVIDCLRTFGPVHGWWAFPFERYNGILARTNTNFKLGESSC